MSKYIYFTLLCWCGWIVGSNAQVQYNNISLQTIPSNYLLANVSTLTGTGVQYQILNNTLQIKFQGTFVSSTLKLGEVYYLNTSPLLPAYIPLGDIAKNNYKVEIRNNFLYISKNTTDATPVAGFGNNKFLSNSIEFLVDLSNFGINPTATSPQNYVKTTAVLVPNQTNSTQIAGLGVTEKAEQYTYFDGLGREIQMVAVKQSPLQKDIVAPVVYDDFGRLTKNYLPYTITNNGAYRNNALQEVTSFYQNTQNIAKTNFPFSETILERAPNSNSAVQGNIGESWQILRDEVGLPSETPNNHIKKVKTRALVNGENIWQLEIAPQMESLPTKNAVDYSYNMTEGSSLWVEEIQDEHQNKTFLYKDIYGQILLKKVQKNATEFIQTYYVYDVFGQLRYVLPPLAVEKLTQNGFTFNNEVKELVFYYKYDYKKRVVVKKVPNAGETHIVYDQLDRVIMTQDAKMRDEQKWLVTKYDVLGRVALTFLFLPESSGYATMTRAQLQSGADAYQGKMYEDRTTDSKYKYWTLENSYPNIPFDSGIEPFLLTVSYYDDYNYNNLGDDDVYYDLSVAQMKGCANIPFSRNKLKPTGSLVRILDGYVPYETGLFIPTNVFYDDRGRVIQTKTENHLKGGIDIVSNKYDFSGKLLKTHHFQRTPNFTDYFIINSTQIHSYDHAGRIIKVEHQVNDGTIIVLSEHVYNEIGQLINKKLGRLQTDAYPLQNITYDYNVRGWLTHINKNYLVDNTNSDNSLFGMELIYDQDFRKTGQLGKANYNGNITGQKWKSKLADDRIRSYNYAYDNLNRMTDSKYQANLISNNNVLEQDWFNETLTYDSNGNILNLVRTGLISQSGSQMNFGVVDDFTYQYQGNRLLKINNAVTMPTLHTGNTYNYMSGNAQTEYQYNQNGSLISDNRKGIETIIYNHLNLPKEVKMVGNNQMSNLYDATGIKLQKNIYTNNQLENKYDYISGNVYKNGVLEFLPTPEGRIIFENNQPVYEYHYKDHLGNLRVAFKEAPSAQYIATAELANQTTEQTQFANVNATRADKPQILGQKACLTNVANTPLGWWKSLPVKKGDKLNIQTEGYYSPTGRNRNLSIDWNTFLFINPNYGVGQGESPLYPANSLVGIGVLPILSSNASSVPKAYLTAQFFKEGESVPYLRITKYIMQAQENIWSLLPNIQQQVAENGRVEIFVANESSTPVYFDNLQIQYQGTPIVQENHYYPFGMNLVGIEKEGTPNHRFQFMDREKESSFGLNWTETDWRSYDAQVGRFWQVDKLADMYWDFTPYHYVGNNPINMTDPSGLAGEDPEFYSEDQHLDEITITPKDNHYSSGEDNSSLRYAIDALGIGKSNSSKELASRKNDNHQKGKHSESTQSRFGNDDDYYFFYDKKTGTYKLVKKVSRYGDTKYMQLNEKGEYYQHLSETPLLKDMVTKYEEWSSVNSNFEIFGHVSSAVSAISIAREIKNPDILFGSKDFWKSRVNVGNSWGLIGFLSTSVSMGFKNEWSILDKMDWGVSGSTLIFTILCPECALAAGVIGGIWWVTKFTIEQQAAKDPKGPFEKMLEKD